MFNVAKISIKGKKTQKLNQLVYPTTNGDNSIQARQLLLSVPSVTYIMSQYYTHNCAKPATSRDKKSLETICRRRLLSYNANIATFVILITLSPFLSQTSLDPTIWLKISPSQILLSISKCHQFLQYSCHIPCHFYSILVLPIYRILHSISIASISNIKSP